MDWTTLFADTGAEAGPPGLSGRGSPEAASPDRSQQQEIREVTQMHSGERPAGPMYKRGRGKSFFKEPPRRGAICQVPNCDRPLVKLKDYYKRYKICPHHLELPSLVVEGQAIRFCQQCGRFQLLEEFDGDRRSCRKKLEKHNERRRRAEEGLASDSDSGEGRRGGKASRVHYAPPGGAAAAHLQRLAADPALAGLHPALLGGAHAAGGPYANGGGAYANGGAAPRVAPAGIVPALPPPLVRSAPQGAPPPPLQQQLPPLQQELDPALLALLAQLPPGAASDAALAPLLAQLLAAAGVGGDPAAAALGGDPGAAVFGGLLGAPQASRTQPPHVAPLAPPAPPPAPRGPEHALAAALASASAEVREMARSGSGSGGSARGSGGSTVSAGGGGSPRAGAPEPAAPAPEAALPDPDGAALAAVHALMRHLPGGLDPAALQQAAAGGGAAAGAAGAALDVLRGLGGAAAAPPPPADCLAVVSLKLFQAAPGDLPPSLVAELQDWVARNPTCVEAALRPGCVHVSLSALLDGAEADALAADLAGWAAAGAAAGRLGAAGAAGALLAQAHVRGAPAGAAVVAGGRAAARLDAASLDAALGGGLAAVRPLAATPDYSGPVLLFGTGLCSGGARVYCRAGADFPTLEVVRGGRLHAGLARGCGLRAMEWVEARVPALPRAGGALAFEKQAGVLVSAPRALLVLRDAAAVAEVRGLEADAAGVADVTEFLLKAGAVVGAASGGAPPPAAPAAVARLAAAAAEVAAVCVLRGWPALLRAAAPALTLGGVAPAAAVAAVEARLRPAGAPAARAPSLLAAAAAAGNAAVLEALADWGRAAGHAWAAPPAGGLSPLHLAALLPDPLPAAAALTDMLPGAAAAWAAPGPLGSPLGVAAALGAAPLLRHLAERGVPGALGALRAAAAAKAPGADAAAAAAAASALPASLLALLAALAAAAPLAAAASAPPLAREAAAMALVGAVAWAPLLALPAAAARWRPTARAHPDALFALALLAAHAAARAARGALPAAAAALGASPAAAALAPAFGALLAYAARSQRLGVPALVAVLASTTPALAPRLCRALAVRGGGGAALGACAGPAAAAARLLAAATCAPLAGAAAVSAAAAAAAASAGPQPACAVEAPPAKRDKVLCQ